LVLRHSSEHAAGGVCQWPVEATGTPFHSIPLDSSAAGTSFDQAENQPRNSQDLAALVERIRSAAELVDADVRLSGCGVGRAGILTQSRARLSS